METNQYMERAKAAVERAKEMIANNESTVHEIEIKLTGSAYSDSASHNPKPHKGTYTQDHGGVIRGKVNAEFHLKDAWRALSTEQGAPWDKNPDFAVIGEACDWLVDRAAELGFEL